MLSTRNLKAGDVLDGRYRLERRVGGGGMGDVWESTDTVLWRTVAVKILLADLVDDRGFRERFRREARAIAAMRGTGIVEVYDYGEIDHREAQIAYLVMEFVRGQPLSRLLGLWGKLAPADALRIIGGVAEALQVAHSSGIVHRDIKPGNILARDDGSAVLVDFGIARANHNLTLTTTGVVLGTVTYMSPEQAAGENLTPASDLYSLGVVAHQSLSGTPPFRADTPLGVLSAHLRNKPPSLPATVPRDVADIVIRALQKEPSARWPNAAAFAEACHQARAKLVGPPSPPPPPPAPTSPPTGTEPYTGASIHLGAHPPSHTGELAAPPPTGPTEVAAEEPEAPQRRRLWAILAGAVAIIVAAGAIALNGPWNEPAAPGTVPTGQTDEAGVQGQDGAGAPTGADRGATPGGSGTSQSADPGAEDDESGDEATATAAPEATPTTGEATGTASPDPSPSVTEEQSVPVPEVTGRSESTARQRIEEAGLAPSVVYQGEGDHRCGVVRQSPSAGTNVEPDSTVQVTVKRAADDESCKPESDETEAPREESILSGRLRSGSGPGYSSPAAALAASS